MTYGIWLFWFKSKEYGLWVVDANDNPLTFQTTHEAQAAADAMGFNEDAYEIRPL
jgi:hypothetical protein